MIVTLIVALSSIGLLLIIIALAGYLPQVPQRWRQAIGVTSYSGDEPARRPVTLWVWLSIVIVPLTVGLIGLGFAYAQQLSALNIQQKQAAAALKVQQQQAQDEALQAYLDDMGNLLVNQNLAGQAANSTFPVSTLAQARTLTLMETAGPRHKRLALVFLYQANLITRQDPFAEKESPARKVMLEQSDLSQADLRSLYMANVSLPGVFLNNAQLDGADLKGSDLSQSYLNNADLREADLSALTMPSGYVLHSTLQGSDFKGAILDGTRLQGADLRDAHNLTQEQIEQAEGDESTKLPENLRTPKSWSE